MMTMSIDQSQHRFTLGLGNMDHYASHHSVPPHFTNPWVASSQQAPAQSPQSPASSQPLYVNGQSGMQQPHRQHQPQHQQQHQPQPHQQHHQQSPLSQQHVLPSHQQQRSPIQNQLPPMPQPQMHRRPSSIGLPATTTMPFTDGPMATTSSIAPGATSPHGGRRGIPNMMYGSQRDDMFSILPAQGSQQQDHNPQPPHQHQHPLPPPLSLPVTAGYADHTGAASYSAPSPIHATSAAALSSAYTTTGPLSYEHMAYAPASSIRTAPVTATTAGTFAMDGSASVIDSVRRFSHPDVHTAGHQHQHHHQHHMLMNRGTAAGNDMRRGYQDAIEAGQSIVSLSQDAPRSITYGTHTTAGDRSTRSSGDSYGFHPAHSTSSSISSQGFGFYNNGSMDSSVTEYSTAGSDLDCTPGHAAVRSSLDQSAATPRQSFVAGSSSIHQSQPPAPQSMMSQFSSRTQSTAQKKHKCKVCDKRFTRPSSLQTHMYSHTGEKPFVCEFPSCGRQFSVISNLRRHAKVHLKESQGRVSPGYSDHQHDSPPDLEAQE